jgi:hypothetical protein
MHAAELAEHHARDTIEVGFSHTRWSMAWGCSSRAVGGTSLSRGNRREIEGVPILTLPGIALIGNHHAAKRDGSCDDAERI